MDTSSVKKTTIRAIGNSAGATIPKVLLEKYNFHEGDTAFQLKTENGILLSPYDPEFETSMVNYFYCLYFWFRFINVSLQVYVRMLLFPL